MKFLAWKHLLSFCLLALTSVSVARADDSTNVFSYLREKYDELPEKGKFATGAVIGFGGSRIAINSAVGVVKVAGAAFIATEVLNAAGALDDLPKISDEHLQIVESFKVRALNYANDFRNTVRRRLNPEKIKSLMETDRMATLGVATGAFVGFLL